jgi:hypothetical protein
VSPETGSKIFLPRKIIQQPPLGLVAGSQSADPAAAFDDGQPGLVRAGDSRDPHAHLYERALPPVVTTPWLSPTSPPHNAEYLPAPVPAETL